ncbi:MAG: hypothetical protein QOJ52_350 [Acidimicrobiaceae bacterium]|nr:hypothetical protein [Acidimicrobiaceae bacterium]
MRLKGSSSRHGSDAVRAALALLALSVSAFVARAAHPNVVELNAFRLINQLPGAFGPPLLGIMQLGALASVLGVAAIAAVRHRPGLARRLLAGGVAAWAVAKVLQGLIDQEPPDLVLGNAVLHSSVTAGLAFPATHVAVAAALATVAGPYLSRPNRRLTWIGVFAIGVARVYVGAHFPIDVVGGAAVGWGVGSLLHLILGSPRALPDAEAVRALLAERGHPSGPLDPLGVPRRGNSLYRVCGPDPQVVKVVGRDQPEADWLYRAWRLLAYRDAERRISRTPQQLVEHEAYLLLLAQRAGVCVPALVATSTVGEDAAVLVRGWVEGTTLGALVGPEIDDAVLVGAWQQLAALHSIGIALGSILLDDFVVGPDGQVWLVEIGSGVTAGPADRSVRDNAELCVAVADRYGPGSAARSAAAALDVDDLRQLVTGLQPLLLSPANRRAGAHDRLLERLRFEIAEVAGVKAASRISPARVATRNLLPLVAALLAVNLLLPQIGKAGATFDALHHVRWVWAAGIVAASAVTYLSAAVSLMGAASRRLGLGRTTAVQLAAAFTNRLAPAGIGGMATNVRYLEATGYSRPAAIAALGMNSLGGFVVHLIGVLTIVPLFGAGHTHFRLSGPELPDRWPLLAVVVGVLAAAGLIRWGALLRRRLGPPIRSASAVLSSTLGNPRAAFALLCGATGVTAGYIAALAAAGQAFGVGLPLATVAAVFLGGSAVAAAAPTPGGLGALEAALVAGLTAAGAASGPAIAAVLVYRLITYWLPIIPGAVAYHILRRDGTL